MKEMPEENLEDKILSYKEYKKVFESIKTESQFNEFMSGVQVIHKLSEKYCVPSITEQLELYNSVKKKGFLNFQHTWSDIVNYINDVVQSYKKTIGGRDIYLIGFRLASQLQSPLLLDEFILDYEYQDILHPSNNKIYEHVESGIDIINAEQELATDTIEHASKIDFEFYSAESKIEKGTSKNNVFLTDTYIESLSNN